MSGPGTKATPYYRPAEVAAMLRCSEWWIKEQARRRRIPFSWIGGSYLFTEEHVAEIVKCFEVRPRVVADAAVTSAPVRRTPSTEIAVGSSAPSPASLRARPPRRSRTGSPDVAAA